MAQTDGRYVLGWRSWTLWFIPVLATLYFVWILLVALGTVKTPSVDLRTWAIAGMVLFGILLLLEILLLLRRKGPEEAAPVAEPAADETVIPYAQPGVRAGADKLEAEIVATGEQWKGLRVLEVSIPPKSRNKGGVYAKSYVQVAPELVLRVEDLVADRRDVTPTTAPAA